MGNGGATSRQATLFKNYDGFVEKFKTKKTTDDCYTPPEVYETVLNWARREYGISDDTPIIRPFYPGGDYERAEYPDGCVVVDNPPFSILSQIINFYTTESINFFLFAPTLTCFNSGGPIKNHVITSTTVIYDNGAKVNTSFVTNMGEDFIRSAPDLQVAIEEAQRKARADKVTYVPKYSYPDEVLTAAMVGRYSRYGVDFRVKKSDCAKVCALESQRAVHKTIFGSGFLLSERAAAEHAAAERAAAERAAAERAAAERAAAERADNIIWELSPLEREIIKRLGGDEANGDQDT